MKAALPLAVSIMALAACVPATPAPAPAPPTPITRPVTARPAPPPVAQAPVSDRWMDVPATPGKWRYEINAGGPIAVFGKGDWVMACKRDRGTIDLWRAGLSAAPRIMTIRTETVTRSFQVVQAEDTNPYLTTRIASTDPLLDAMALSKGRFAVETEGLPTLYLPSWAEVSRVIEDCR